MKFIENLSKMIFFLLIKQKFHKTHLPETKMCSDLPLATPAATTPTPTSETNFTEILAAGLAHFKS